MTSSRQYPPQVRFKDLHKQEDKWLLFTPAQCEFAKKIFQDNPGIGYLRKKDYFSVSSATGKYVWMSEACARALPALPSQTTPVKDCLPYAVLREGDLLFAIYYGAKGHPDRRDPPTSLEGASLPKLAQCVATLNSEKTGTAIIGQWGVEKVYGKTLPSDPGTRHSVLLSMAMQEHKMTQFVFQHRQEHAWARFFPRLLTQELMIHPANTHYEPPRLQRLSFIVEYLFGFDLVYKLEDPSFTIGQRLHVLCGLIEVLYHMHKLNIVHRDIKLENILLVEGRPYVLDLAFAYNCDDIPLEAIDWGTASSTDKHLGRLLYAACKKRQSTPTPDNQERVRRYLKAMDVYALGLVFFVILPWVCSSKEELMNIAPFLLRRTDVATLMWDKICVAKGYADIQTRSMPAKEKESFMAFIKALHPIIMRMVILYKNQEGKRQRWTIDEVRTQVQALLEEAGYQHFIAPPKENQPSPSEEVSLHQSGLSL